MKLLLLLLAAVVLCADPRSGYAADVPASTDGVAEQLYSIYLSGDYFALEKQLGSLDLHDPWRGFFEGQLEAAFLHDQPAQAKLRGFLALPGMSNDWRKEAWRKEAWRKEAWYTLAATEAFHGDYDAAANDAAHALEEPSIHLDPKERAIMEDLLKVNRASHGIPPQNRSDRSGVSAVNVTWSKCQTEHDGLLFADYRVNGLSEAAVFDTGASLSIASESFAQRHGLHLLPVQTSSMAGTGRSVPARIGIADEVQIGQMSFQHVVFVVFKDADFSFLPSKYSSVIGLPLIFALGHLRVSPGEGRMEIGLPSNSDPANLVQERNLAFHRSDLLVCLKYQGSDVPFTLDTGASLTHLYDCFGQRFPQAMQNSVLSSQWSKGLDGNRKFATVTIPQLELGVENHSVLLHDVAVHSQSGPLPSVAGRIGGDLLSGGYELDFHQMHFSLLSGSPSSSAVPTPP